MKSLNLQRRCTGGKSKHIEAELKRGVAKENREQEAKVPPGERGVL